MLKAKVFLICSGLGRINRGYESFTKECFEALKNEPELEIFVYKGGGESNSKEIVIQNLGRNSKAAKFLSSLIKKDSYYIEQLTFFFNLLPSVLKNKPDVIYFSDFLLGCWLHHIRKFFNLKYKLLFSNGAPNGPPFNCSDHVQQLLPYHYNIAIKGGESPAKHSIVPYGLQIKNNTSLLSLETIIQLKIALKIPLEKKIILSVGAINCNHKRMDYLIKEISNLKFENYFLIILGQYTEQTGGILKLAKDKLPEQSYMIKSVEHTEIESYYQIADLFVLASLSEGLPRVILEALAYGLPVVCHDYGINRETLQHYGVFLNMQVSGNLTNALSSLINNPNQEQNKYERMDFLYKNYSWDVLKENYKKLILDTIRKF